MFHQQPKTTMTTQEQTPQAFAFQGTRATIVSPATDTTAPSQDEQSVDSEDVAVEETGEPDDLDALLEGLTADEQDDTEVDDTKEEDKPSAGFVAEFEQHFGMSVDDAKALVQELAAERSDRTVRQQQADLATHWGVDAGEVTARLMVVRQLWEKLPAEKQAQYDNAEGAKAIYAKLQASGKAGTPKLDRNSTRKTEGGQSKWMYTQAQINALMQNPDEYAKEADNILRAYQLGKVKK